MSTPYEVQSGDWLQKIAEEHGFASWRDLYYHEDNAAFRAKRPDPDKIYPGDIIMIPDQVPGGEVPPGGEKPPGEDKTVVAGPGDTLCSIAVDHGFPNCLKLREHPDNKEFLTRPLVAGDVVTVPEITEKQDSGETEQEHEFVRKGKPQASIRFVHGSKTLPFEDDATLNHIDVSNYKTDQAGLDRQKPFANENVREFQEHADADPDTFKVEVFDLRTTEDDLPIEIDALRPVYKANGSVEKHEEFPGDRKTTGTEAQKRSLDTKVKKQGESRRFRTCYLRLVVDENDQGMPRPVDGTTDPLGRPKQTVLTKDMTEFAISKDSTDATEAAQARQVEILDQVIRARYVIDGCVAPDPQTKCLVEAALPVGHAKKRVKLVLHILRKSRDGAGVVTVKAAQDFARKFVRRWYAQANMSLEFVAPFARLIQPPTNMISIGNKLSGGSPVHVFSGLPGGTPAAGGSEMAVGIKVDGGTEKIAKITTKKDDRPKQTAEKLATAIRAQFPALTVQVFENNPNRKPAGRSADILVGDNLTQKIELRIDQQGETNQRAEAHAITSTTIEEFADHPFSEGTPDERSLLRNYSTGDDRVDAFIVGGLHQNSFGEAWSPERQQADPELKPQTKMINSVVMRNQPISNDIIQRVLPHEMGHVLMDVGHVVGETTEMMTAGLPAESDNRGVDGPKRISDPANSAVEISYDAGFKRKGNPVKFLREHNTACLTGF